MHTKVADVQIRLQDILKLCWNRYPSILVIRSVVFITIATIKNNDKMIHTW